MDTAVGLHALTGGMLSSFGEKRRTQLSVWSRPHIFYLCRVDCCRYYGFDPHDDSDNLRIHNNVVWNNGKVISALYHTLHLHISCEVLPNYALKI